MPVSQSGVGALVRAIARHELRVEIQRALVAELGDTYDCTRVWSAWSYGTMDEDDFVPVLDRLEELIDSIEHAVIRASTQPTDLT